jgi:hypothetical protein
MRVEKLNDIDLYQTASLFTQLFDKAVKEAKEINRKNGLPNDFVVNGKHFYELPNGEIVSENPLNDTNIN